MIAKKGYYIPRAREMDMVPSIWNNFSECGAGVCKLHGFCMKTYHVFIVKRQHIGLYKQSEWQTACGKILKKFLNQPRYFKSCWKKNEKVAEKTIKYSEQLPNKISQAPLPSLIKMLVDIKRAWIYFDQINVFPWFLGAENLEKYIADNFPNKYRLSKHEVSVLLAPNTLSLATQEEYTMLKKVLSQTNKNGVVKSAAELSRSFGWMPFGYDGPDYWDAKYYIKKIGKLKKTNKEKILSRIKEINQQINETRKKQKDIVARHKIKPNDQRLLDIWQKLFILTDERKKVHFKLNYAYHEILKKLEPCCGFNIDKLKYLDAEEIQQMFLQKNFTQYKLLAEKRQNSVVCAYTINGQRQIITHGHKAKQKFDMFIETNNQASFAQGLVANTAGKKNLTGKAKIIINPRKISSMKKGEILITPMTTPDFVPAMRKARGIITDEGGITSHAAIVSRELGIPCIIGTRIATKVFKDGDIIELDTIKGIVKKL